MSQMTVKQALNEGREKYAKSKTQSVAAVLAMVVGPFRPGDSEQHGLYNRAVMAVYEAACPRKVKDGKQEFWNTWVSRLPHASHRKDWLAAFDKAIADYKED